MVDEYDWLGESIAGAVMTAVATSLPELVTSIAAVRRGALTLTIGGNCFDTLFAAVSDIAYREGSIYHAAVDAATTSLQPELALIGATVAMTSALLAELLFREKDGPGGIGFESVGEIVSGC